MATTGKRYEGMDLARAVLMTMGVFFHAALIFSTNPSWLVRSNEGHIFFDYFIRFIHDFRMPAFYIIAGFFSVLVFVKYGREVMFKSRLIRLSIPMITVGFTLNVVINYLSDYRYFEHNIHYLLDGHWLGHLWFLGNLIIYISILLLLTYIGSLNKLAFTNRMLMVGVVFIGLPIVSTLLIEGYYTYFQMGTRFVFISFSPLVKYLSYYLIGVIFFLNQKMFFSLIHFRYIWIYLIVYLVFKINMHEVLDILHDTPFQNTFITFSMEFMKIFIVLTVLSTLNFLAKPSKLLTRFNDASYTIYLLHYPLTFFIYYGVTQLNLGIFVSFLVIIVSVFFLSYYFHHLVLKRLYIVELLLNGKLNK